MKKYFALILLVIFLLPQIAQAAISFVGSAANSASPTTDTVVTLPGSMAADDLIIVAAAVGDTTSNGLAAPTQGGYARVPGVAATLYSNNVNNLDPIGHNLLTIIYLIFYAIA